LHGLRLVASRRFDAIHAGRVLPEGLVAIRLGQLVRIPVVIYAHGEEITTWCRAPRRLRAMKNAYRAADLLIANSEFTRNQLLALGVAPERIRTVYPGVDTKRFRPGYEVGDLRARLGLTPTQPLLLSVGRLSRRKGFDQLIRATAILARAGVDLHYALIGIGEDLMYLKDLARTEDIVNRVHFLGHVEMDDLPRWYNACELLAMPNREIDGDTEGFGMVFLEAAACGKPALAGRAGGTGDAVLDGETGIRADGDDLKAIVRALRELLTVPGLASRLGDQARDRATREFEWSVVATKTSALSSQLQTRKLGRKA
jgi:phosphatidylinositol alpha-1,6-mannosyltransferase